jgi:hypothetical protein
MEEFQGRLFEDIVQPVELDLMLEAWVIEVAVNLAAINKVNHPLGLLAGQFLVELMARARYQGPLALGGYVQQGARNLSLKPGQAVTVQIIK